MSEYTKMMKTYQRVDLEPKKAELTWDERMDKVRLENEVLKNEKREKTPIIKKENIIYLIKTEIVDVGEYTYHNDGVDYNFKIDESSRLYKKYKTTISVIDLDEGLVYDNKEVFRHKTDNKEVVERLLDYMVTDRPMQIIFSGSESEVFKAGFYRFIEKDWVKIRVNKSNGMVWYQ